MYEWLLVLHVLSAFALVASLVAFWALTIAARTGLSPALGAIALPFGAAAGIGTIGTLVFGIWLAIYVDGYEVWDGWVLGAIALWALATESGRRAEVGVKAAVGPDAQAVTVDSQVALMHWLRVALVIALLVVMIYKPGA